MKDFKEMKALYFILSFILYSDCYALNVVTSLLGNVFKGKTNRQVERDYELESMCFSTSYTSNTGMPTKIHLLIIYDQELANDLKNRKAQEYFKMIDDLKATHSQFIKIMEWILPAKAYISPYITISYNNKSVRPVSIMIFSNIGGKKGKSGRYEVHEKIKHLHITVHERKLTLTQMPESVIENLKKYRNKFK